MKKVCYLLVLLVFAGVLALCACTFGTGADDAETVANVGQDGKDGKDGVNGQDGQDGAPGQDGRGIDHIAKTNTQGNVDTYTIYYTDDTTDTFTVTNGRDGIDGQNGQDGYDGKDGADDISIVDVALNEAQEVVITLSNGTTCNLGKLPAAQPETSYLAFYPLDDGTLGVAAGNAVYLSTVEIPATYQGRTVSTVLPNAFAGDTALTCINLPDTLVRIGAKAFANCTSMTSIFIPESVTDIAQDAFEGCSGLVFERNRMEVAYDTQSYVAVGDQIKLRATAHVRGGIDNNLVWQSLDPAVATVDEAGNVTGVAEGYATVRVSAANRPQLRFDFGVTVFDQQTDEVIKTIIRANNSNIEWQNLGIGSGTPAYYVDMIESVSKILYNYTYKVNTDYESVQAGVTNNHGGALDGVEFITVHYTGNMSASAGAAFHANYFANGTGGTSIHYVTGNDGDGIYHILDNSLIAYHAGDGATTASKLVWLPTGVMYQEDDPLYPEWGISSDSYYTLNGAKTSIAVPTGNTDATKKVTDAYWFNDMGFAYKVVGGEYYMAKTWWCYSQVTEGRLCTRGGNRTSLGIESCVNRGSDIWYTWHLTAKLVAHLMQTYNVPIERVVGHHFYTAKDCPQPMLENDLDLWWDFKECVQAECDLLQQAEGYQISMTLLDDYDNIADNGRVNALPTDTQLVRYRVTVTDSHGAQKQVTLAAMLNPTAE